MILLVCENLKYDANEHFYKIDSDRKQAYVTKGEREQENNKLGVWGQQIQTTIYKINTTTRSYCTAQTTIFNILNKL